MHALSKLKPTELLLKFGPLLEILEPDPVRRGTRHGDLERTILSKIHAAVDEVYIEISEEAESAIFGIKSLEDKVARLAAVVGERREPTVETAGPAARVTWLRTELERLQKKQKRRETVWKKLQACVTPILGHLDSMDKLPDEDLTREGIQGMERLYRDSAARLEVVKERLSELYDWLRSYEQGGPGQYESVYYTKNYRKNLRNFIKGKASSIPAFQLLESISTTLKFSLAEQHTRDIVEVTRLSSLDFAPSAPSSSHEDDEESDPESVTSTSRLPAPSESGRDQSSGTGDDDADESDSDASEESTTLIIFPFPPNLTSPADASHGSTSTLALLQSATDLESYNIRLSHIDTKIRGTLSSYIPRRHIFSSPAASTSSSVSRLVGGGGGGPPRQTLESRLSSSDFRSPVKVESGVEDIAQAFVNIRRRGASASPKVDRKPVLNDSD